MFKRSKRKIIYALKNVTAMFSFSIREIVQGLQLTISTDGREPEHFPGFSLVESPAQAASLVSLVLLLVTGFPNAAECCLVL